MSERDEMIEEPQADEMPEAELDSADDSPIAEPSEVQTGPSGPSEVQT